MVQRETNPAIFSEGFYQQGRIIFKSFGWYIIQTIQICPDGWVREQFWPEDHGWCHLQYLEVWTMEIE